MLEVALNDLEKYHQTVQCIHQWDLGGTETRSLSHCENALQSNSPAGSVPCDGSDGLVRALVAKMC